ncbi:MAG: TIGR02099 family protein [Methylococcales symbiont of Hymedesmia sp. n. MRB-2018]|nr:MAG: TIGR02099 family protein [Methylococcales symbiont of Hymedesmia sp. n. MRB-2018]
MNYSLACALRTMLFILLIVVAIAINAVRFFLLSAEDYKADLQSKVRELTELPINIGQLHAHMRGFNAEIILDDIQILASNNNELVAVKLKQIRLNVSLLQLLFTQKILPSSWLTLVGVDLSIIRNEDGSLSIAGLTRDDSEQPYWLLEGRGYEILNSHITWLDNQRKTLPIEFRDVDLLLKNGGSDDNHELHFLANLAKEYGESLRVSMAFNSDVFAAGKTNGNVYIEGKNINLTALMTGGNPLGLKIKSGQGSFKQWGQVKDSKFHDSRGSIQARNIVLEKQNDKQKPLHIKKLKTAFNLFKKGEAWALTVVDLFLENNERKWPAASFSFSVDNAFNQITASILHLDFLQLTELMRFFTALDFSEHDVIKKLHLKGELKNVAVFIDNEKAQYAVNGAFNNIFIRAFEGFPEIKNLTGSIKGSNEKGVVVFDTHNGQLFFSELFKHSFAIEQLTGQLKWEQSADKWQISSESLILNTGDVETETKVLLSIPKNEAPVFMNLQASFANMQDISQVSKYYPVSIMDEDAVEWLDKAFVSGKIKQGKVRVYGELDKFPFVNNQGVFEVQYEMKDVELQYNSDWPNLNHLNAGVVFFKNSVSVDLYDAQVNNLSVKDVILKIPSFTSSDHLLVKGKVEGQIFDGLHFLQKTPIHTIANNVLNAITPKGLTVIDLDLKIPLSKAAKMSANVTAHLSEAALKVNAVDIDVSEVTGDLTFTEKGFYCKNVSAKALGYPIQIDANSDDNKTLINIVGKTDIQHLEKQFDFFDSWILKGQRIKGSTAYKLKLDLPLNENKSASLKITTELQGVAVDFPETLKKSAEQKASLTVSMALNDPLLLPLSLNYQEELMLSMTIDKQKNKMISANIVYAESSDTVRIFNKITDLEQGIKIQLEREKFDSTQWMAFIDQKDTQGNKEAVEIKEINLITKQLQWKNKSYGAFELAMHRLSNKWQGNISSSMAKGAFVLPIEQGGNEAIKLNMAHLNITELMQVDFKKENITVEKLPLINVESERLLWKNSNLGSLTINSERLLDGIRFNKIDIASKWYKVETKVDWVKSNNGYITDMYGTVKANNFGKFLNKFHFDNDFKNSEGSVEFFALWPGAPYQFSLEDMNAEMDIELKNGRLASVEPGFGRVLGLIAMEQWLKRLTLDFDDIYKKGMSFNSITGHFTIMKGNAASRNLFVDAVPARIFITGDADLIAETFDHRIAVVPKSSGALPIAGTIVSGIVGVITQVFSSEYRDGYFFGSEYKVQGSWDDFKVTAISEKEGILKKTWSGLTDFSWMKSIAE